MAASAVVLMQATGSAEQVPVSLAAAAALAVLLALVPLLPFLIWRRTRRWAWIVLGTLWLLQFALQANQKVVEFYSRAGDAALPWLLVLPGLVVIPSALLLWRRTRRLGLVLLGTSIISLLVLVNYWAQVICSIGYILLLLALWPRWRLMQAAPSGRERRPAIPSLGVFRVRSWPACRRPETEGFTLVTTLVGVGCLLIAAALATQMIAATMVAVRRADHLAVATDLLESVRERSLLGRDPGDVRARAARLLPKGTAALTRAQAQPGLTRVSAVATWEDVDGKAGQVELDWLTAGSPR